MAAGSLPDPMGGQGYVAVSVVTDIVPVRVVNSNPLDVRVVNFPGVPPPLPGLRPGAMPPPLPRAPTPTPPPGLLSRVGLGTFGLGQFAGMATAAGAVAGGIGLAVHGLQELKATFIDPILGAAKGGFDRGVARGAGVETLSKAFEVLGVTIGTLLLPAIIELGTAALETADYIQRNKKGAEENPLGVGLGLAAKATRFSTDVVVGGVKAANRAGGAMFGAGAGVAAGEMPKVPAEPAGNRKKMMDMLIQSMMEGQGAKASFVGLTDIREQAQLAAMQDPLERELKNLQLEALRDYVNRTSGALNETAKNTKPPEGGQ